MNLIEIQRGLRQVVMALMFWADMCFGKTLNWLKLSNSGDTLKLMIPSYSRKAISGQTNHLGTVTSHKIDENQMGYRGSKSEFVTRCTCVRTLGNSHRCVRTVRTIWSVRCTASDNFCKRATSRR